MHKSLVPILYIANPNPNPTGPSTEIIPDKVPCNENITVNVWVKKKYFWYFCWGLLFYVF